MPLRLLIYELLLLSFTVFVTPVLSQNTRSSFQENDSVAKKNHIPGETYAIIIGISNYHYIRPLTYADKDAELFKNYLMSAAGGKVREENILLIKNEKATWANLYAHAFDQWIKSKNIKSGDKVYIYFAGHGAAIDNTEYFLLTYDSNPIGQNFLATGTIRMYDLKNFIIPNFIRKGVKPIMVIDACRTDDLPIDSEGNDTYNYEGITEIKKGEILFLSASGGQKSLEDKSIGNGHGLFTWFLVDGLIGNADKGVSGNNDGIVSLYELGEWTKKMVTETADKNFNHHEQIPYYHGLNMKTPLAEIDSTLFSKWQIVKNIRNNDAIDIVALSKLPDISNLRDAKGEKPDSNSIAIYNQFIQALKEDKLRGDRSAEMYYDTLEKYYPNSSLTNQARYELATSLVTFGQEKINLHLTGKDNARSVEIMKTELGINTDINVLNSSVQYIEKVVHENYKEAAYRMQKGIDLLRNNSSSYLNSFIAKAKFLKAKSYFDDYSMSLDTAIKLAREAKQLEPGAAYINYLLGGLMGVQKIYDSALYYKKIALKQSPNWVYPLNDIGIEFENKKQFDSAIYYYKKAISIDKNYAYSYYNASNAYKLQGMYDTAELYSYKAINADPGYIYAFSNLADIKNLKKQYDSAGYYYRKALEINPQHTHTLNSFGINFYNQHKFDSALKYYQLAINADPGFYYALYNIALIYQDEKKYDSSNFYIRKLIAANPMYSAAYNAMGLNFEYSQMTDSAFVYYKKTIETDSLDNYAWYNLGRLFQNQKKYPEAEKYLKKALQIYPSDTYTYNLLGINFDNQLLYDSAIKYYKKALEIEPDFQYSLYNLGRIYRITKQYAESRLYLNKTLSVNPNYTDALNVLGLWFYDQQQYDSALYWYNKVLLIDKQNYYANINSGYAYKEMKQDSLAIHFFRKALDIKPNTTNILESIGLLYESNLQYDSSLVYYKELLELYETTIPNDYFRIGRCYFSLNRYDSAIVYYKKAYEKDAYNTYFLANIGYTYQKLSQLDSSVKYFKNYLAKYPEDDSAYARLAHSYELMGNMDSAIFINEKIYDRLKERTPDWILGNLGYENLKIKDYNKSLHYFLLADSIYNNASTKYNLACYYSIKGDKANAIVHLTGAFGNNYRNFEQIQKDTNLDFLRKEPEFKNLLRKYFPSKFR